MNTTLRNAKLALLATACLAFVALSGCTASAQSGSTAVFVRDSPSDDITHLYVTFTQVKVHQSAKTLERLEDEREEKEREKMQPHPMNGTSANGTGRVSIAIQVDEENETDEEAGWFTVSDKETTIDLKAFQGGASEFLGGADVPVGTYNQILVKVTKASATLPNGTSVPVKVPSGALHIKGKFTVSQGNETQLTIDFDLEKSLKQLPNGSYVLKPVLHLEGSHHPRPHLAELRERERRRDDDNDRFEQERDDHDGRDGRGHGDK